MTADDGRHGIEVPASPRLPAVLHPFRALRLAPEHVGELAALRPMSRPYRRAARRLEAWEEEGRLTRDAEPALHVHEYSALGITVRGVVGALDLSTRAVRDDERAVLPHEAVHLEQVEDLAARMEGLRLNPAPILLVHRGTPESRTLLDRLTARDPDQEFTDHTGQLHRQWRVVDPNDLRDLAGGLSPRPLLVADGHHRYDAYLRLQAQHPGTGWDRGLAMVVDQEDTPLQLGAIHRLLDGVTLDALTAVVRHLGGTAKAGSRAEVVSRLSRATWAATDGARWVSLTPRCGQETAVETLHRHLIPTLPDHAHVDVRFRHSVEETEAEAGPRRVAVLLPSPGFDEVERASLDGRLLPEKATSFQPKPSLGVYMRAVRDD